MDENYQANESLSGKKDIEELLRSLAALESERGAESEAVNNFPDYSWQASQEEIESADAWMNNAIDSLSAWPDEIGSGIRELNRQAESEAAREQAARESAELAAFLRRAEGKNPHPWPGMRAASLLRKFETPGQGWRGEHNFK